MIGRHLSHFKILDQLGKGGMGEVWAAEDTKLRRQVALKTLPQLLSSDPQHLGRFQREAETLASLNHPNIVTIYSVEEAEGRTFIAMELVEGQTLTERLAAGPLDAGAVLALALPVASALAAAHERGITHRDLKPDNIMIGADGRPKVLDFGLARVSRWTGVPDGSGMEDMETLTREGGVLGSCSYMSPEQARGETADPRSDVFSLGIILYQMLTGRRPFQGANFLAVLSAIVNDPPAPIRDLRPTVPPALEAIVERCLEKDPERRFASAVDLHGELAALETGERSGPSVTGAAPPEPEGFLDRLGRLLRGLGRGADDDRERRARSEGLPKLERIVERIQFLNEGREAWTAFELASELREVLPDDPLLELLWPKFTCELSIVSDPPGARVRLQHPSLPGPGWTELGTTPLEGVRYPRGFTRIRLDKPGYRRVEDLVWDREIDGRLGYKLHRRGTLPDDMEWVPAGAAPLLMPGLDHQEPEPTAAFLIDRDPVTNAAYKRFLDDGGYQRREHWPLPFVDGGRELSWDEAMARFVDRTGRPGPATWEVGDHPPGEARFPVGGVSWYEAAAYAAWAGKSLPTLFHWNRAAYLQASSQIVPFANLARPDRAGTGPVEIGTSNCVSRYGVRDLAGNVREWIWNASDAPGDHFILGGGWNDPPYAFNDAYAQPGFDRSPTNGFRCVRAEGDDALDRLRRAVARPMRDFLAETPVSDEVFEVFLRQFDYDRTPLDDEVLEEERTDAAIRQRITFRAAYGRERVTLYLFLPKTGRPPYQTVVLFPGSDAIHVRSSAALQLGPREEFLVKSGRAVAYPVYKGTFERGGDVTSDYPEETTFYKDYVIHWAKDLSRTVDYLETRDDLDAGRLAYYGLSWGAALGAILPAVERRFRAMVLYVAGFMVQRALPEVDAVNYVGRVTQPTLMLDGELDYMCPKETSQRPMFELLGTPPEHKKWLVYPGGHSVPRTEMIREVLAWLDRYLGPVE